MSVVFYYVVFAIFAGAPTASALGLGLLALRVVRPDAFAAPPARWLKRGFFAAFLVAASGFALAALFGQSLAVK